MKDRITPSPQKRNKQTKPKQTSPSRNLKKLVLVLEFQNPLNILFSDHQLTTKQTMYFVRKTLTK